MRPASGQPRLAWPCSVAIRSSAAALWLPRTPLARRSSSSTARASSSRSITAWESLPSVKRAPASRSARDGPIPSARSRSVVGQKQHQHAAPPSSSASASVRWVAWTAVNRSPSTPRSASSPVGRASVGLDALLVLGRLLRDVGVQRCAALGGPRRDDRHRRRIDGADGVDRRTDAHAGAVGQGRCPRRPRQRVAVGEAALRVVGLDADAPVEVARVEQRDPHARLAGGRDQRLAHRVGVGVRGASGAVVEVVELADRTDAGEHHLGERGPSQPEVGLRVERRGDRVHLLAPCPERSRATVRAPAQGTVEGVAVGVGEARKRETRQADGIGAARPRHRCRPP